MLMSKIYVPFVPNERDHRKLSEVLNRLCAFNRKKNPHERPCVIQ